MLDRGIGLAGLALAVIFGAWSLAPDGWPKLPVWAVLAGVLVGVFLIGMASALVLLMPDSNESISHAPTKIETRLSLQFSDTTSIPVANGMRNIRRWYAIYTESIFVDTKDKDGKSLGGFSVPPRWTVFILFEKPPLLRQMVAVCRGPNSPKCEVKTSDSDFAIVTAIGDVTDSILNISGVVDYDMFWSQSYTSSNRTIRHPISGRTAGSNVAVEALRASLLATDAFVFGI